MDGGMSAPVPAAAAAGLARRPDMPVNSTIPARPVMPDQGNAGGAMRGLDRAAAMSGRTFPNAPAVVPSVNPAVTPASPAGARPDLTGLSQAAAMSGRTMPTTGVRPDLTGLGQAAAMSGRTMPATGARPVGMKKGGKVASSASKRADGIAQRGKTKGRMV